MNRPVIRLVPVLLSVVAAAAAAQTAQPSKADPANAAAAVPPVVFRSTFSQYQRYAEQSVGSWKEVNETVNRIGGWRAYTREAQQPEPPVQAPAPGTAPARSTQKTN